MKKVIVLSVLFLLFSVAMFSSDVLAVQINSGDITGPGGVDPGAQSNNFVASILNGVYQISAMVAVLMIVISGVRYILSDGDPGRTQSARKGIIYSLVGLVIIGSAFIITGIVQGLF